MRLTELLNKDEVTISCELFHQNRVRSWKIIKIS